MIADGRDDDVRGGTLLLDRSATAKALEPRSLLDAIETALLATSLDTVSSPPRIAADTAWSPRCDAWLCSPARSRCQDRIDIRLLS